MATPNLTKTLTLEKNKEAAASAKAEAQAKAAQATAGTVLVRLKSPFWAPDGTFYEVGIREIPSELTLPSSAVRLERKEAEPEDEDDK